jgi:predicted transport protein
MEYVQMERLSIKSHAELGEKWVQERIADDPSIIGLGDVIMKDKERLQPRAGRLDLLLQDVESNRRYEVEVQLGKTDESHIIRTIEYWDIERRRYPQYDHTAVIVAEEVTSRFLNVISLFNGVIPLVAVQMSAFQLGDQVSLVFTTVVDQVSLGLVDEDEEVSEVADRGYWEKRGTPATVKIADELFAILQQVDPGVELKYNKFYIGMSKDDKPHNFVVFRPRKSSTQITVRLQKSEEHEQKIEESGLDLIDYSNREHGYRIRIKTGEVKNRAEMLRDLFAQAHKELSL